MNEQIRALVGLDRGQFVKLGLGDGSTVEVRVNQFDYVPDESLRLELSNDESGEYGRYQARASAEDGEWSPVELRGYDPSGEAAWTTLGTVTQVTPLEAHRMQESEDETGHEG